MRISQGDVFPAYSSLRADPLGTRVLHDSLALLPGLAVERRFKPLARLDPAPPRTIVLAGFRSESWGRFSIEDYSALDAAVREGARLVIAFHAVTTEDKPTPARGEKGKAAQRKKTAPPEQKQEPAPPASDPGEAPLPEPAAKAARKRQTVDLAERWGLEVRTATIPLRDPGAWRALPGDWPDTIGWASDLRLIGKNDAGWTTLYGRGSEPVLVERALGRGTIVVAGDAYFLSNEGLQRNPPTTLLAWIVGSHPRVVFDESHLGVVEDTGIAALARRYGLASAFFTLLLLAALWVWQRMALFVPPPEESHEVALSYHPAAGLEALLRRSVPAGELGAACAAEWKRTGRPGDVARVEAAIAAAPKKSSAAALHNLALRALRRR
ncbi:MAG: DUF4350 domain-containing protein [Opitutaceae bacterium]|nr:DUF4350 domain-containing protein [Opitutaceae bacterium]